MYICNKIGNILLSSLFSYLKYQPIVALNIKNAIALLKTLFLLNNKTHKRNGRLHPKSFAGFIKLSIVLK